MDEFILIDGATGYLGSHLTNQLRCQGRNVRCLVRKESSAEDVRVLSDSGAEIVRGSMADEQECEQFFQGARYAVHLIGSIAPPKGQTFVDLHQNLSRAFAQAAKRSGVQKILLVTALGTSADAVSQYHKTKWLAEEEVRKVGLRYTILRPSLLVGRLFGRRDSKLVRRLLQLIDDKPFVPLINGGANKIQPLFIKDMVEAASRCLSDSYDGETIELGGSTVLSMRRFVEALQEVVGKRKPIINLRPEAGKLVASLMEMVQEVPTLSKDQVVLSMSDNICQANGLSRILGTDGSSLDEALGTYRRESTG